MVFNLGERKPKVYKVDVQRNHHDSRRLILRTVPRFNFRIAGAFIAFMFVLFGALVWMRGQEVGPWWTGVSPSASPPPPPLPSVNIMAMGGSSNDPAWTIDVIGDENFRILSDTDPRLFIKYDGKVGIGTTDPSSLLSVGSTSQFQVDSSGAIAATTGITVSDGGTVDGVDISTIPSNYAGAETVSRSIYVDHDTGSDSNGGASWGDAFWSLQHAVDSIKLIIADGVTVTIYARGEFSEGDPEAYTVLVNRVCAGTGKIEFRADAWIESAASTAVAANTLTYVKQGVEVDDYWNSCIVWVNNRTDAHAQVRRITDTVVSGTDVTITVDINWNSALTIGDKIAIAGRARFAQADQWSGIWVTGANTKVYMYGFAGVDFEGGESAVFGVEYGFAHFEYCAGYNNSSGAESDFGAGKHSRMEVFWSASGYNGNMGVGMSEGSSVQIQGGADKVFVIRDFSAFGIYAGSSSVFTAYMVYENGGTVSMLLETNAVGGYIDCIYGVDGSSYGIRVESGAGLSMGPTIELTISYGDSNRHLATVTSDVTNSTTTLANIDELYISVTAGTTYRFYALINYSAQATATGSRWTINGPAMTSISYLSSYPLTSTTRTFTYCNAVQLPASANSTSAYTTGNTATIEGMLTPSADGTVYVQFASEAPGTNNTITAEAGSTLEWW